ncbi:hypothetical protein M8J76_008463 [Diaphorina citri]|nr:hypothetical protein M8J76_008463 [Diaphorina citri]
MISIDAKNRDWLQFSSAIYTRTQTRTKQCQSLLLDVAKVIDAYETSVASHRTSTEHALAVNIGDIRFRIGEISNVKANLESEIASLELYRKRASDFCAYLEREAIVIVRKCLQIRQNRQCVDLYRDSVDEELTTECALLHDIICLMVRLQQQASEHTRRLKRLVFVLNNDLRDKDVSVTLDETNAQLKQDSLLLKFSHEENTQVTKATLRDSNRELYTCRQYRALVDLLLKQTVEHLDRQREVVDESLTRKIEEYQEAKVKLENQHSETLRSIIDLTNTISDLDKAIQDKRGPMMLAHSRLGNRSDRPGIELVRDEVDARLELEIDHLQTYTLHLQSLLAEAKATLRNLTKVQHELEENINVKSNSLKLDQVDF